MTPPIGKPSPVKSVLIIEDEGEMCLLLNLLLANDQTTFRHAKTLASAKEDLKSSPVDLLIIDNRLPDGFGVFFLPYLKKNYPHVKVIMISGYGPEVSDLAFENGVDGFLEKPFDRSSLVACIESVCSSSNMEMANKQIG